MMRRHPAPSLSPGNAQFCRRRSVLLQGRPLALMRRIDLFKKHPFYGSRQMVRQLRREGVRRPSSGAALDAADGPRSIRRREPACCPICSSMTIDRPNRLGADIGPARLPVPGRECWATRHVRPRLSTRWTPTEALNDAAVPDTPPGDLQHRPGQPVHQSRLYRRAQGRGRYNLNGRSGPLHGQHLHRAPLAVAHEAVYLQVRADDGFKRTGHRGSASTTPNGPIPLSPAKRRRKGAEQPVDMMDKAIALPTFPQAQRSRM